jgi:hypothetical protein
VEVDVRFRYISIKGDWEHSKAEGAFLNSLLSTFTDTGAVTV